MLHDIVLKTTSDTTAILWRVKDYFDVQQDLISLSNQLLHCTLKTDSRRMAKSRYARIDVKEMCSLTVPDSGSTKGTRFFNIFWRECCDGDLLTGLRRGPGQAREFSRRFLHDVFFTTFSSHELKPGLGVRMICASLPGHCKVNYAAAISRRPSNPWSNNARNRCLLCVWEDGH